MEKLDKSSNKALKLWDPGVAFGLSFFFTPIFSAWIHAKNWDALGQKDKSKKTMMWLYGMIAFLVAIDIVIPSLNAQPTIFIGLVWFFMSGIKQINYIKDNNIEYEKKPWTKLVLIMLLVLYVPIILFMVGSMPA